MKTHLFSITKKDLIRQTFRCGGNGGQNVNKVETGVRFIHEPSGARGESCTYRTQGRNERAAFERLANSRDLQQWIRIETARRMGHSPRETPEAIRVRVDREVDAGLRDGSIVVEEI